MSDVVYITGIILQGLGGLVALLQVRWAPHKLPWLLIAISALLIVYRRAATLGEFIRADRPLAAAEVMTLAISLLFFVGVLLMSRMFREITENQSTQKRQTALVSSLLDSIPDMIFIKDLKGFYLGCNDEFARHVGLSKDEVVGKNDYDLYPAEEADQYRKHDTAMLELGMARHNEEWITYPDGRRVLLDTLKTPYNDNDGSIIGLIGVARDITERKQAETALRQSEETHRALVTAMPDILMRFDRDKRHLFVSDNVSAVVGIEARHFIGKTHRDLGFTEEQCRFWEDALEQVFNSNAPYETEYITKGLTGPVVFNWCLVPERDEDGSVSTVLSLSRDITEQRKVEHDYQTLFREMLDGFALHEIICDDDGNPDDYRFLDVNPAFERMTGLKAEEIIGRTVLEVMPGTEYYWIEKYGRVALTGEPDSFESYSSEIDKNFAVTVFRHASDQFVCIFSDITVRTKAEEALRINESLLAQSQQIAHVGSWDLDLSTNELAWSDEVYRIFGFKPQGFAPNYQSFLELVHPAEREYVDIHFTDSLTGNRDTFEMEHRIIRNDTGETRYVQERCIHERNVDGEIIRSRGVIQDISERKKAEKELKRLNIELDKRVRERTVELEKINKELDAFAYSVSHDLRAPLRRIKGFSEAIITDYADKIDSLGQDYLKRISSSVNSMDHLIDDLLKLSRVSRHEIERERVDLSELAKACLEQVQEREPHRQVEAIIEPRLIVAGDTSLLRIALENILENAWKYTSGAEMARIELGSIKREGSNVYFISDNGIGFDMTHQEKLFSAFQRLHSEKDYPGTGIGLSIVSRIITRHGGKVWADSTPGKGATFYFTLP